jgi:hypothetical protein
VWPEDLRDDLSRNAQELVWHAMGAQVPARDLSLFEVTLFCLIERLVFRPTQPIQSYRSLLSFSEAFAARASAGATVYRFDTR